MGSGQTSRQHTASRSCHRLGLTLALKVKVLSKMSAAQQSTAIGGSGQTNRQITASPPCHRYSVKLENLLLNSHHVRLRIKFQCQATSSMHGHSNGPYSVAMMQAACDGH